MKPNHTTNNFNLAERLFLRYFCFPPPQEPFEPRDAHDPSKPVPMEGDPLSRARRVYGNQFERTLEGRVFLDIGCGPGHQVLGAVKAGAKLAVGIDKAEITIRAAKILAAEMNLSERVYFTTDTIPVFGTEWADVALSQNSFEHFDDPGQILAQAYAALKPGGKFFITFGPTWWHPFGAHHMFMIKIPWAHLLFSEKTILRVRQMFRPNKPICWREVALNQMTIAKFTQLARKSNFTISRIVMTPIRPLPQWLVNLRPFREWTTSDVSVILIKSA